MRSGYNWTFFGIPTAQVVSLVFVAVAIAILIYRHRPGAGAGEAAGGRADGVDPSSAAATASTTALPDEPVPG